MAELIPAQGPRVLAELSGLAERLRAAGEAVREAREAHELRLVQRDSLIVEAHDVAGFTQGQISKLTGLSQPSINRILRESQPDVTAPA